MILDDIPTGDGALHALHLLDPEARERFGRELRANPALAECVDDFQHVAASVALARCGPLVAPPVSALTGALARAGIDGRPGASALPRVVARWKPLAAAAAIGLLLALSFWKGREMGRGDLALPSSEEGSQGERENGSGPGLGKTDPASVGNDAWGEGRTLRELLDRIHRLERGAASPKVIQDLARLRGELASMKKADAERFSAGPRLSRTVVVEMVEPGLEEKVSTVEGDGLSERVGDYIAAGIDVETEPEAPGDLASDTNGTEATETPPVLLEEGSGLPDLGGVSGDAAVYYRDFPAGNDAFERIDAGRVWDAENQRIWIETSEPGLYRAVLPPEGFDPDFPQDFESVLPAAGTLAPPVIRPAAPPTSEVSLPLPSMIGNGEIPAMTTSLPPVAFSIYDETTGRGSVIVGNLGSPGAGNAFQLWMRDAGGERYVSVGLLPPSTASVERFDFDLLGPGLSPSEFMLTVEGSNGAAAPGSTVILHGP